MMAVFVFGGPRLRPEGPRLVRPRERRPVELVELRTSDRRRLVSRDPIVGMDRVGPDGDLFGIYGEPGHQAVWGHLHSPVSARGVEEEVPDTVQHQMPVQEVQLLSHMAAMPHDEVCSCPYESTGGFPLAV